MRKIVFLLISTIMISCNYLLEQEKPSKKGEMLDISNIEEVNFSDASTNIQLKAKLIPGMTFLEHVFNRKTEFATNKVIIVDPHSGDIYESTDLGVSFELMYKGNNEIWNNSLTTSSGNHILWNNNGNQLYIFNSSWDIINIIKTGEYSWLGSYSIAESYGVIIYAEYVLDEKYVNVWRSNDDGSSWEKIFTLKSTQFKDYDIRHFHTVQPDPYFNNNWYLSSGDMAEDCRIWKSDNNGTNWVEVTDASPMGYSSQRIHRYTGIHFDEEYLYWGTDDLTDGKAKFVRAKRGEPLQVEKISDMGNIVQAMIDVNGEYLFISEQKSRTTNNYRDFTIHYSQNKNNTIELFRSGIQPKSPSGFTYSRCSIKAVDGKFFSHYLMRGGFFKEDYGTLIWSFNK